MHQGHWQRCGCMHQLANANTHYCHTTALPAAPAPAPRSQTDDMHAEEIGRIAGDAAIDAYNRIADMELEQRDRTQGGLVEFWGGSDMEPKQRDRTQGEC